ncbi:MAG TPA: sigma factor-like helix-turn-helix DNA-binding protein [Gammaproteobacteria bacterium]|nr:sigma factor-like helix-turn-helix DNA-binding protein [Gammaproteobacteria bacterium]
MEPVDRGADDVALSALIDDELPDADAERMRARLRSDGWLARRFIAMTHATAVIRLAYRNVIEVVTAVAAVYGRSIQEGDHASSRGRSVAAPGDEDRPVPLREIDWAVAGLTSEQRSVLCLAVLEELDYLEIAAALRVPGSAVMVRLAEARAALAASLGETLPPASETRH